MTEGDREAGATAAVFALAASAFAWTALPGPHWHDTAEFAAVAWRLSLSHPPGHPLHALLTQGAERVPLGDIAFRANLLSALATGAALAVLYRLLRAVAPDASRLPSVAAALLPAVMPAVWLQAVRAEVYGLQLLLCVAVGWLAVRVASGDDARALPAMALVFGLAGANHSLIGAAFIPLALVALWLGRQRAQPIGLAVVAGALGTATYLYLPLRARRGGEVGWGMPDGPAALWETISGRAWQANLVGPAGDVDLGLNALKLFGYAIDEIGLAVAALLAVGVSVGVATGGWRRPGLAVGALGAAGCVFATRFFYPFDALNPDLGGYFAPGLVAVLVAVWSATAAPWRWAFLPALAVASPGVDPGERRGQRVAESVARAYLEEVPPDGALVLSDYGSTFLTWYLRAGEGARPDVALVFRGQTSQPWVRARLAASHPARAAWLGEFPRGFDGPEVRYEPGVEAHRVGALLPYLAADGVTLAPGGPDTLERLSRAFARLELPRDLDSLRALALLHAHHAEHHLRRGARTLAAWHLAHAEALAPSDPWLARIRAALEER